MPKKFRAVAVSVPQPCNEDWGKMTPEERGRFCETCGKVVVDFSAMTDTELIAGLRLRSSGCGNFRASQLERLLVAPRTPKYTLRLSKVFATVMAAAGIVHQASAQKVVKVDTPSRVQFKADEIERMGLFNPLDTAALAPGVYQRRSGGGLNIGGGRGENTLYVVDGIVQVGTRGIAQVETRTKKSFWKRLLFWKN